MITVDTTCLGRALWLASGEWRGWVGVMSLGADRLSGSCEIGFDARSTIWNVFTIVDVNRRRDYIPPSLPVYPLQFGAHDQDCVPAEHAGRWMTLEQWQWTVSRVFGDRYEDRPLRESTQVRWGGQDGRREPDSGIDYTQDHRTRWTDDGWMKPDSFGLNNMQLTGRKRRAGSRSAVKRIPDGTVLQRDNQWGIPRKCALFASDGPDVW